MTDSPGFWFKSDRFVVEPGEDSETNPGRFGRALSSWLVAQLRNRGFKDAEAIPEDWGWCVTYYRGAFSVWIGCGNVDAGSPGAEIVWHCFPHGEPPFWKPWLRWTKRREISDKVEELRTALLEILSEDPRISLVDEP